MIDAVLAITPDANGMFTIEQTKALMLAYAEDRVLVEQYGRGAREEKTNGELIRIIGEVSSDLDKKMETGWK